MVVLACGNEECLLCLGTLPVVTTMTLDGTEILDLEIVEGLVNGVGRTGATLLTRKEGTCFLVGMPFDPAYASTEVPLAGLDVDAVFVAGW